MEKVNKYKIAIIEDEVYLRRKLAEGLIEKGHEVFMEREGPDGLLLVKEIMPDIIILDLCMDPRGMDEGHYFLEDKNSKKNPSINNIPVIIISGKHPIEELEKYKKEFDDVFVTLVKPVSLVQILNAIKGLNL